MTSCPPHIQLGVVQLRYGNSAPGRLAYQMCTAFNDGHRREDFTPFKDQHLGGLVLLPEGAPAEFADESTFITAIASREKRVDAQAGRTLDVSLPRGVPKELLIPMAAFVVAPFVAQGMAIRLDVECPAASDGGTNPHAHGFLSQRALEENGFGKKYRPWNELFLRNMGRHVRALVAGRVTLASALVGVGAYMDPRRNEIAGLPEPEVRVPRQQFRRHERGEFVASIENLKVARRHKKATESTLAAAESSVVTNAVTRYRSMSIEQRQLNMNFVVQLASDAGAETFHSDEDVTLSTRDGSTTFDGEKFTSSSIIGPAQARLIVILAQAFDWPAMVVEGNAGSADELIIAGVPIGLTAINRCASPRAILLIRRKYGHLLADTIRPLDPLAVAMEVLEVADVVEAGNAEVRSESDVPEELRPASVFGRPGSPGTTIANLVVDDRGGRLPLTPLARGLEALRDRHPDDVGGQHRKETAPSEPKQKSSKNIFDDEFDFPEPPKPTILEDEFHRQLSADIWKNYADRVFEALPLGSNRAARETRPPSTRLESCPFMLPPIEIRRPTMMSKKSPFSTK
ncbi:MobA/MobL family protein [Bradyrhizobium guangzhouense]|uniref:MobA/MobL protein domain-containing protein n=1 Tax=Bradyrhizobium guangzhouense TaxID=1325095 RepID=A0AAE5WZL9_9BRAD|nr:MobA/MobL family protein [Bradyrhizobium guangzhouense]QAU45890.1 hypothetical protein XH91_11325 [Bradyrhizobium guangzhouense]